MSYAARSTAPAARVPSRRAEAWVHGVLNPLMDTLSIEIELLRRGNLTFHGDTGELVHIGRLEDALTTPARHVLRDFLHANRDAEGPFRARESACDGLARAARAAHGALRRNRKFRALVGKLPEALGDAGPAPGPDGPSGGKLGKALDRSVRVFGEFVVNRRGTLPDFDSDLAPVWNRERTALLARRVGAAFERCDAAATALLAADRRLLAWLRKKSFKICERHEIAAAPVGDAR